MTRETALRLRLLEAGFSPLPCMGKAPQIKGWQTKFDTNADQIRLWEKMFKYAANTGILTVKTPAFDIDIRDETAAKAVEMMVREWLGDREGAFLVRVGKPPKRAVPFQTNEPFRKIQISLTAPDGSTDQKLEFLGDGQQIIVYGTHPDTNQPYRWTGGEPGLIPRDALPHVTEQEADELVNAGAKLLIAEHGYRPNGDSSHHADGQGSKHPRDWDGDIANIAAGRELHDLIASLAMKLLKAGMDDGAAVNFLRAQMSASPAVRDARWQQRYDDIGRAVRTARQKIEQRQPRAKANGKDADKWPTPHPLPDSLLPVVAFDLDLIPEQLRPWVGDIVERMQCPADYTAVSLMAALGSMIGRKIAIRPLVHDDWSVICNQWALLIGRPGVLKSPAMEETLRPLRRLSAMAEDTLKREMAAYEVAATTAKIIREENVKKAAKVLRKDSKADISLLLDTNEQGGPEPTLKRYIANDTNVASLGVLLQQNPNGLLIYRDEIVSLLDNLDREESVSERGFYLTGWNGDSRYTFDRIGRGLHLSIDGVCLSMLGSTQPGRISQYLSRAIKGCRGDDGLIQRFGLMVWPDVPAEWNHVDRWPDHAAKAAAMQLFERLDALDWHAIGAKRDRGPDGDEEGLPYLRFSIEAYDMFMGWRSTLERRLRSRELHVALEAHLAKYRKLVPGLCLISHLADGWTGPVGVAAVRRAIAWATFLETHAQRAYGSVTAAAADTAKAILAKIRSGHLKTEFSSREVWRPQWSRLTDRDAVAAGLAMLVEYDWLGQRKIETVGRPQIIYSLNPKATGAFGSFDSARVKTFET